MMKKISEWPNGSIRWRLADRDALECTPDLGRGMASERQLMTIMTRRYDIELIKQLYQSGVNIGSSDSSLTAILYPYDAQAGSYIDALQQSKVASLKLQTK